MEGLKACTPDRELCCLDGETGPRTCTKKPFWYCGCSSVSLGLNWRKSHWHIQESRSNAEKLSPLKICCLLLQLTCISLKLWVFFMWFIAMISHERHVFVATQIRLHSCYWVSQSLYNWLSILPLVTWSKNIRSRNGFTSYIYFQTSRIYTSSLRTTVPRKVQIAKIWGLMPLNISFMTKFWLKVEIIA